MKWQCPTCQPCLHYDGVYKVLLPDDHLDLTLVRGTGNISPSVPRDSIFLRAWFMEQIVPYHFPLSQMYAWLSEWRWRMHMNQTIQNSRLKARVPCPEMNLCRRDTDLSSYYQPPLKQFSFEHVAGWSGDKHWRPWLLSWHFFHERNMTVS